MKRRAQAGKRQRNASTAQSKVNRVYFRGLGLLNQVKSEVCSQDHIERAIRTGGCYEGL